jgi:hypothetical protein
MLFHGGVVNLWGSTLIAVLTYMAFKKELSFDREVIQLSPLLFRKG